MNLLLILAFKDLMVCCDSIASQRQSNIIILNIISTITWLIDCQSPLTSTNSCTQVIKLRPFLMNKAHFTLLESYHAFHINIVSIWNITLSDSNLWHHDRLLVDADYGDKSSRAGKDSSDRWLIKQCFSSKCSH